MIDVNKVFEPNFNFYGLRRAGYRQISQEMGIKTSGNDWNRSFRTLLELRNSYEWSKAEREYKAQKAVADIGLAPCVYALTAAYNLLGEFVPCIQMEHVESITLQDSYIFKGLIDRDTTGEIIENLQLHLLEKLDMFHFDVHGENILLVFDREKKYVLRELLIDFEHADCRKIPLSEARTFIKKDTKELLDELDDIMEDFF